MGPLRQEGILNEAVMGWGWKRGGLPSSTQTPNSQNTQKHTGHTQTLGGIFFSFLASLSSVVQTSLVSRTF